jgi:hypothetical protein
MINKNTPAHTCYGLIKSGIDAHTLGISHMAQLIEECGYRVLISPADITDAVDKISNPNYFAKIKKWVLENGITRIGFSYRLDPGQALNTFGRLVTQIENDDSLSPAKNGAVQAVYFAGLPEACQAVEKEFGGRFPTFRGDETPIESLKKLGVSEELIPKAILEQSVYDNLRMDFGKALLRGEKHKKEAPSPDYSYPEYGTIRDHLNLRLRAAAQSGHLPLFRVHAGPYLEDREKALALFSQWLKKLTKTGYLDIISVGSSQLSQSHFGEDWDDLPNGGGVPFNSEFELRAIREDASPMLVRAYSGTSQVAETARILENNLNMAWHALSFWWFNRIDGRGPLTVKQGLKEHLQAVQYIASAGKPFEPNIPHHFAFRGGDDISYVVSAYLAARTARKLGIRTLVLQNMLNTPKSTQGLNDLAKARALLRLVRSLEGAQFRVVYQPRAGLDYFSPDIEKAKIQLAAVSALMADVEPGASGRPEIIHVVSYSEALHLADPDVIDNSIRITKAALRHYPEFRRSSGIQEMILSPSLQETSEEIFQDAGMMIADMEKHIPDLYSAEGLYQVFKQGYFPVPYLWEGREEFEKAVQWNTKPLDGGVRVVDEQGHKISIRDRLNIIHNMREE